LNKERPTVKEVVTATWDQKTVKIQNGKKKGSPEKWQ
jgi:hypothetical protein